MKLALLPINIPSPLCNIDAVSTQTRSPSPTSWISVIFAVLKSKLFVPIFTKVSSTSPIEPVWNMTPSTPTSKIENIFRTSFWFLAIVNICVWILCNFAMMFSRGIIFQSFTSIMTKSSPFFAVSKTVSMSLFERILNCFPIFLPFSFFPSLPITT